MKITERGWGAHFICGFRCRFRRNTLIEGLGGKVIVSTVGNMGELHHENGLMDSIGASGGAEKRYYETMIFETMMNGPYEDIDVSKGRHDHGEECEWAIWAKSPEELPEDVDLQANKMHETMVKFYVALLKKEARSEGRCLKCQGT